MKIFERTLILLVIFHLGLLLLFQTIFHYLHLFPHFNEVTRYEGVNHHIEYKDEEVVNINRP
ncbi:DUF5359 family protein [Cytobacillus sp. FSL K6-0265]|uniref:DUF5359 family protein n=1 Tax=Cytobacillus sp. FSL K6-0265 TaxID=2921448 RepID=UPI0030FA3AB7